MKIPLAPAARVDGFARIVDEFDALIIDQFGVLHDGAKPYPAVRDGLLQLHGAGKRMIVLSNSGRRSRPNADQLAALGLPVSLFDAVITSGEIAWRSLHARADPFHRALGRRCVLIAAPNDTGFIDGLGLEAVASADEADFLLAVTVGASQRIVADCERLLEAGARRGIPLLCANSDIVRPAGTVLVPAPGALAQRYAELGGPVHHYGKPLRSFFEHCLDALNGVPRERVLMVGDSLEHDILGAQRAGIGSVYIRGGIGSGIGWHDLVAHSGDPGLQPTYVMERFGWRQAPNAAFESRPATP
ncbi:MAG: TIGR01459 family HAD-type hydrolase [Caldimonas sp.]